MNDYDQAMNIDGTTDTTFTPVSTSNNGQRPPRSRRLQQCTYEGCDKKYTCDFSVQQHIREAHTLERPYKCPICGKSFPRRFTLNRHMRAVHGAENSSRSRRSGRQTRKANGRAAVKKQGDPGRGGGDDGVGRDIGGRSSELRAYSSSHDTNVVVREQPGMESRSREFNNAPSGDAVAMSLAENLAESLGLFGLPAFYCDHCGRECADQESVLVHLHFQHGMSGTPFCPCDACTLMYRGS